MDDGASTALSTLAAAARPVRRRLMRHRRLVTALLLSATALAAVNIWAPATPPHEPVVVAARDLPAGIVLSEDDVRVIHASPQLVPTGAARSTTAILGHTLAGPMRAGEVMTDQRVFGPALLRGYDVGLVGSPVRLADADIAALLEVGDHVDVYAATGEVETSAERVVVDAPVIALPAPAERSRDGALIVLALNDDQAGRLAQAAATTALFVTLRARI